MTNLPFSVAIYVAVLFTRGTFDNYAVPLCGRETAGFYTIYFERGKKTHCKPVQLIEVFINSTIQQ